ncbi:MAG: DNA gyrase subunit A [Candidatus Nanopelagicales bacterium]
MLPSRFPNLLVNGSSGIAVGMATNIPPHNLNEVADGIQWALAHPDASKEELLDALIERVQGPDFRPAPTSWAGPDRMLRTARAADPSSCAVS